MFVFLSSPPYLQSDLKGIDPRWASSKDVGEAFSSSAVKSDSDTIVIFLQSQVGARTLWSDCNEISVSRVRRGVLAGNGACTCVFVLPCVICLLLCCSWGSVTSLNTEEFMGESVLFSII